MTNSLLIIFLNMLFIVTTMASCKKDKMDANPQEDTAERGITTILGNYSWSNVAIGGGGFVTGIVTCSAKKNIIYARTDVGGAYKWIEETGSWKPLIDFVSENERSYLGVESIAIDPSNPNKVFMAVGTEYWNNGLSAILISDDYGETYTIIDVTGKFKFHGNGMGRQNGERLMVDPNNSNILFVGTRAHGLWKSTDSGLNWSRVPSFPVSTTANNNGICFVQFDKTTGVSGSATQTIYAGVSRSDDANLFVSNDAGDTWSEVTGASTSYMPMKCLLANSKLYVSYADAEGPWNPKNGKLFRLNISSGVWTDISPETGTPFSGISTNADNSVLLAASLNKWINQGSNIYGDEIYISTNDGISWSKMFQDDIATRSSVDIKWVATSSIHWAGDIQIDPFNTDRAFVISGNGIFMTKNLTGANPVWEFTSKGLEETVPMDLASLPGGPLISVILDYDGFQHKDIQEYPENRHIPSIGSSVDLDFAGMKPNFVVRIGGDQLNKAMYYSEDYGNTWSNVKTSAIGKYNGRVAVSSDAECIIWTPKGSEEVYRTIDMGQTWTPCEGLSESNEVVADQVNPDFFYSYSSGGIFYISSDKGVKFYKSMMGIKGGSPTIRAVPGKEGHVLVACRNEGLYITRDKGTTFDSIPGVIYCEAVSTGKGPDGSDYPSIYIYGKITGSDIKGAYRSDDIGTTWVRVNNDNHQYGGLANGAFIIGDNNVFGRVYLSTAGRGIVYGDIDL